jgi:GMP synthase-like glutamine amidotransferase
MREIQLPPYFFKFDALERSWYDLFAGHQLIPVANTKEIDESIEFDCLVLTGGPDSVERNTTENNLFYLAEKLDKPIFGFCHGAFAINDLTGGENGNIDGHYGGFHDISLDGTKYTVNSWHSQSIQCLGENMIPIAFDESGGIEAFKHINKDIVGVVWHPERMSSPVLPNVIRNLIGDSNEYRS